MWKTVSRISFLLIAIGILFSGIGYKNKVTAQHKCVEHKWEIVEKHAWQSGEKGKMGFNMYTTYHNRCKVCGAMERKTFSRFGRE